MDRVGDSGSMMSPFEPECYPSMQYDPLCRVQIGGGEVREFWHER